MTCGLRNGWSNARAFSFALVPALPIALTLTHALAIALALSLALKVALALALALASNPGTHSRSTECALTLALDQTPPTMHNKPFATFTWERGEKEVQNIPSPMHSAPQN